MASVTPHKPRTWISTWFFLSSLIVIWDFGYIFLRPRSMQGGDLHWLWSPYSLYMTIDYVYGLPSWTTNDGFPAAQSIMNVFETALNFTYLYLVHGKGTTEALTIAPLVALITVTMTVSKTALYVLNDYCCSWCKTGHNKWQDLIFLWILPNGAWLVVPSIIGLVILSEITNSLKVASGVKGAQTSDVKEQTSNDRLVHHDQLPDWAKDNPLIQRGYRRPGGSPDKAKKTFEHDTFAKCWNSVWAYWHNETVNIHTHLWGAVFSVGLSSLHLLDHFNLLSSALRPLTHHRIFYPSTNLFTTRGGQVLHLVTASVHPDLLDILGFSIFFIAALICLGFSATYHTVGCHSQRVAKAFNKLDYIGIVVMIVGSFLPTLHYGFYCHPEYQILYSVAILVMGGVAMYTVVAPKYATPHYRPYRTMVFLVLGCSAVFPVAHVIHFYDYETITETMGLGFLLLSGLFYILGACLYMARIPELFAPGRFDLLGASHEIFHILILLAAASHYISLRRAYSFWHNVEGLGKAGICLALDA